jgi:hypothetical protein
MKKNYSIIETIKFNTFFCYFILLTTLVTSSAKVNAQTTYCVPSYATGTGSGDYISLVEIPTTSLNSPSGAASNPFYTFFPNTGATTATLNIGSNYALNVAGGTYGTCYISCWGDWNHDTIFDASEFIGVSPNVGALLTAGFSSGITIPNYALSGSTRLRFRSSDSSPGPAVNQSCSSTNSPYGESEDYEVYLMPLPPCSGSPIGGNTISTNTLVCANTSFNLSLANNSLSSGISYQWQSSPNGSVWSNIGSAQISSQLAVNNLTATTYYQCVSTCTISAQTATSTPIIVTLNPLINCYCMPTYALNCANGDKISDFSIANVVFQPSNCDLNGYSDSTSSAFTVINLTAGNTYSLQANISNSGNGGNMAAGAWIDYNQNGIFDSAEFIYLGFGGTQIYSNTLSVPITAPSGFVRMRIKIDASFANASTVLDPCDNNNFSSYGQILDYKVNITAAPACSGTPNAGNAISTETAVCLNVPYILNITNNSVASSIIYQWQLSTDNVIWTNLGTVQNTIPYSISSQSITTYYRCVSTCTISALSSTSTPVVVSQNLPTACFCIPEYINCSVAQITNVLFETINDSPTCGSSGYTDNVGTIPTVSLTANQTYSISNVINTQFGNGYAACWIDYNQNGIFDLSERTDLGNTISSFTISSNINIPFTAIGGNTRMRIKLSSSFSTITNIDPCITNGYDGQILDYQIYITPATPCTGAPNAGDAISTVSATCENRTFTLDLTNNDIVSNISYQWQSSTDNVSWTNIGSSQTNVPYTITSQSITSYYRCLTTCTTSALTSTSTVWTMTQNAATTCYCIPDPMDCTGSDLINYVAFATMTNTSSCGTDGYSDFTGTVPSATTTAGQTYTITTVLGNMFGEHTHAWIDYNQNGIFDSSEYTDLGSNSGNDTISYSITIPVNATPGTTRMRVRNISGNSLGSTDACYTPTFAPGFVQKSVLTGGTYGESEDYLVTILPPDCSIINFPPTVAVSGNLDICPGNSTTLDLTNPLPVATGITYQWKSFNGSAYVNEGTASSSSSLIASPAANTPYYCEILCNGNPVRNTDTVFVKVQTISSSPVTTSVTCNGLCNGNATINASSFGATLTYAWTNSVSTSDIASNICAGLYTVTITNPTGCVITETITITEPAVLAATLSQTNISCYGLTDGVASATVTGGTSPLNFSWLPTGGTALTANNLSTGNYTFNVADGNGCTLSQTIAITGPGIFSASINANNTSICEQLEDTISSTIIGGTAPYSYNWIELPSSTVSTNPNYTYTTSVGTHSYNLSVTDNNGCVANSNTLTILVNPSSNFSGNVTTFGAAPVAGRVVLYKYLPFYTKFDSVAGQNIGTAGDFLFTSFTSGTYIIKAIPTATNMQIAYGAALGDTAVAWKDANQINHGCAVNDVQDIFVKPLTVLTNTTGVFGSLSGGVYGGPSYGQRFGDFGAKPTVPGTPIGGIIVKGGKNPGGQMFVQTITDPTTGTYTLQGLPPNGSGESYFILVDIPGLDTNSTYHRIINFSNNNYQGLDFLVDSAKINPVPENVISVHDISAIENEIKVFPNPASNNVSIQYNLKTNALVKIELFDMLGKSVKMLLPETQQSIEFHKKSWQIDDLGTGLYFIKMTINGMESTIKLSVTH